MSPNLRPSPPEAKTLLHEELGRRLYASEQIPALRGKPVVSAGVPIYSVPFSTLKQAAPLARAKLGGWCFVVASGNEVATAVVRQEGKSWRYHGLGVSDFAKRFLTALRKAELVGKAKPFELRLLECRSVHYYAVWLYSKRGGGKVIGFAQPGKRKTDDAISETVLNKHLKALKSKARIVKSLPKPIRAD